MAQPENQLLSTRDTSKTSGFTDQSKAISKAMEQAVDSQSQSRSDIGQKLQFQLNEANSVYNRSIQAKSNIASTDNQTADALVQNIRG